MTRPTPIAEDPITSLIRRVLNEELAPLVKLVRERQPAREGWTDVKGAAEYLSLSPSKIRALANNGELKAVKMDASWRVSYAALRDYAERCEL